MEYGDIECYDDGDQTAPEHARSRGLEPSSSSARLEYATMVDEATDKEAVDNLITLFETLDSELLEAALPSLCLLAEKCENAAQRRMVQGIAGGILYDEASTRGGRKAAVAALKVVHHGSFWKEFFLLIEALEEPQFHIVRPVLTLFDPLYTGIAKVDERYRAESLEWVWLVIRRASIHTNGWIRLWALEKAVSLPASDLRVASKPLTRMIIPLFNSVDMLWRLVERGMVTKVVNDLGIQVEQLVNEEPDGVVACQLVDVLESVEAISCPFAFFFLGVALRDVSRPVLGEEHLLICKRIVGKFHYIPYVVLKNETTAYFVEFFAKIIDWFRVPLTSFVPVSSAVSLCRDGFSARRLASLSRVFSRTPLVTFDAAQAVALILETEIDYEVDDIGWLLWAYARAEEKTTQFEVELEKAIVEAISGGNSSQLADKLIGVWMRRGDRGDMAGSFSTILTEYVTIRVFAMEGTSIDRGLVSAVFRPLCSLCPQLVTVLPGCILEFLKQSVSTERQAVLLPLLEECLSLTPVDRAELDTLPDVLLKSLEEYLGESPLDASLPHKSIPDISKRDFQRVAEAVHAARTRLYRKCFLRSKDWDVPADEVVQILDYAALYERKSELLSILEGHLERESDNLLLVPVISAANGVCVEERKSVNSLPSLGKALRIALSKRVLSNKESAARAREIFSSYLNSASLSLSVSLVLAQSLTEAEDWLDESWAKQVMSVALFGPVPKKDGKVTTTAYEMIFEEMTEEEKREGNVLDRLHETVSRARMMATSVAINCAANCAEFASRLQIELLAECAELDRSSSKSFGLSYAHRGKTRAVALMLLTVDFVKEKNVLDAVFSQCISFVADPCQQFSIKLIVEWIIVRLAIKDRTYFDQLVAAEKSLSSSRIGSVTSWLNMLMHVARVKKDDLEILRRVLELVVPWVTAQNFAVRCTAVAACHLLYAELPQKEKKKWTLVKGIIEFDSEPAGNARRVIDNLRADFYFSRLHAVEHFDLQTVLSTIPEKTGMPEDELMKDSLICELNTTSLRSLNPDLGFLHAPSLVYNSLAKCNTCAPEMQSASDSLIYDSSAGSSTCNEESSSLQRKIVTGTKSRPTDCSMIVVASLVDKPANLGGLCRTSEIFGVDCLVVADLQLTNDVSFKALSLSSENWQRIEAVRPDNLVEYLNGLRSEGYCVIAAEQTTDSLPMHDFRFPKKCVLVVGDEKEGVPTRLLRCVDKTVEIAQLGQTRSLNVHVTAALFIAKYAEQRLVQGN